MAVTHGDQVAARKLMFAAADIVAIHEAALEVLARTGVVVMDDDTVALLKAAGVRADGRRMFITADQVERALASAPSAFTLPAPPRTRPSFRREPGHIRQRLRTGLRP